MPLAPRWEILSWEVHSSECYVIDNLSGAIHESLVGMCISLQLLISEIQAKKLSKFKQFYGEIPGEKLELPIPPRCIEFGIEISR